MAGSNVQSKSPAWYTGGLSAFLRPGANQGDVIYVDGNGPDSNDGRTPTTPVASFLRALALCTNHRNDTIVVLDYWAAGDEQWPIALNKAMVSIIGVPLAGGMWPQVNPVGDKAGFEIQHEGIEISGLSINAGATHAGVEWDGTAKWGGEVHHCWFGELGTAQDGIRPGGPYAKVWACRFGLGLTRDGVRIPTNSTRGMIGVPGLEPNWFREVPGIAIHIVNQFAQGGIFDNRIALPSDTAGKGITLAASCNGVHIDGNSAVFGETAAAHNNPYLDNAGADANSWGRNYWGEALSVPG